MAEEDNIVEVVDENGVTTRCEVYDVFDFEDKYYALLMPLNDNDEDAELIVLEYIEEDGNFYFQSIQDDEEFERVCEYAQSLEEDDEDEE